MRISEHCSDLFLLKLSSDTPLSLGAITPQFTPKKQSDLTRAQFYPKLSGLDGVTMTKSELIDVIAARADLSKSRAEEVVCCVFDSMVHALEREQGIEIRGFGSFTVRPYKPYAGRNPRTGKPVPVPAKRLPFFKVGKELRELVNASREYPISDRD